MRIVLTGGGSGGHFYPLIAVVEAIEDISKEKKLIEPEIVFMGPPPFDALALEEHAIQYKASTAGKIHRDSGLGVRGFFGIIFGVIRATFQLFALYPDVVFSTGGFAAFPTLFAARILRIPVVIYDADSTPGRTSRWSARFARWIAIGHAESLTQYPESYRPRIAHVGHPIRKEIQHPAPEGGYEFLSLDPSVPTIFIMGGSQGAQKINETILNALSELMTRYNVVHQTGLANLDDVQHIASVILKESPYEHRYRAFGLLNTLAERMAAGAASIVIARAGSGTIFEVASWAIPAILIPIPRDVAHDQTENAFSYARTGAAVVIEQNNLTPHVLIAEIDRIMTNPDLQNSMREAASSYARPNAARTIAQILLEQVIEHQPI